jgi:hypothetical protein
VSTYVLCAAGHNTYIGTIPAGEAITAQRAYIRAFFGLQLRHDDNHLLDGPSAQYPEIDFVASGS